MKRLVVLLLVGAALATAATVLNVFDYGQVAAVALGADHGPAFAVAAAAAAALDPEVLRAVHNDLMTRAKAKMDELKSDTPKADATRIEGEHDAIMRQADAVQASMAALDQKRAAPEPESAVIAKTERARAAEITALAHKHAMPDGFAEDHINKGTALDQVRALVLDHVHAASERRLSNRSPVQGADRAAAAASWDRALKNAGATL
jgi:predicted regulator of Ras-like GTPase activity (Roadblock/LC7/MglB family)